MTGKEMLDLLRALYPLRLAPNSPDTDKCVEILCSKLPFTVHEFYPGEEVNGWVVPHSWRVETAGIYKDGRLIYDASKHPLAVMGYSKSFRGKVDLNELKHHLTYRKDWPHAIGYHCDYYYKPWLSDWGFSIPYSLYEELEPGEYEIDLQTVFSEKTMKVCEYFLEGEEDQTIILNAHNCHAAQANDDISGVVVGVELIKRLAKKKTKFSFNLVICPEHLGTVFYLSKISEKHLKSFKYCIFLEALGNNNSLALQETFNGDSLVDRAFHNYLTHNHPDYRHGKFRKIVGNDETVWESPGIEIPTVCLSRFPFPEYHTSMDNDEIILKDNLEESIETTLSVINILDKNCHMRRNFTGLIALSNPKYDLYFSPGTDPAIPTEVSEKARKWNYLMDCLPRYFDEKTTILEIADEHNLSFTEVYGYICRFKEKQLISFL